MVSSLSCPDVKEETPLLYDDFDPLREWLVDPDPVQFQNPFDYSNLGPEYHGLNYGGAEIEQKGQIVESSIDVKMEKVSLLEYSDGPQAGVGLKKNGSGYDVEINCAKPVLDSLKSDQPLQIKEETFLVEHDDEEGSTSEEAESENGDLSDDSSSDESRSIAMSSSSSGDDENEVEVKGSDEEVGNFEEGEVREADAHEFEFVSDEEEGGSKGPIRSKHEMEDLPPVPKVDVSLQQHHQLLPVGVILSVMDNRVIVDGSIRHNPLDEGSILWVADNRSQLGLVDEIFGPVKNPYYVVRYNNEDEVPAGLEIGMPISFVPEFANQILNDKELYKKGYDASGDNDEEVNSDSEFSDDEKEAEYKKTLRQAKRMSNEKIATKPGTRTDRKMKPRASHHNNLQKQQQYASHPKPIVKNQQICVPSPMGQPSSTNLPKSQPTKNWNLPDPANANMVAPSIKPDFPQAMRAVNFLGSSSQHLTTPRHEAPRPPLGFLPQTLNTGFQGDLALQLQNQNLILNNLVNMMAFQQQLQQLIPHQGSNFPLLGAASSPLQQLGQNNFAPSPFIGVSRPQGPGNEQIRGGHAPLPFALPQFISAPSQPGPSSEQIQCQAPSPFPPLPFVSVPGPQGSRNEQIRCHAPSPFSPSPFIGLPGPRGPSNEQIYSQTLSPLVPSLGNSAGRPQGSGNEQTQGHASLPFSPLMQFNAGNSSSLNLNGGNSRSHGRSAHRGGSRFFARGGGRMPNR